VQNAATTDRGATAVLSAASGGCHGHPEGDPRPSCVWVPGDGAAGLAAGWAVVASGPGYRVMLALSAWPGSGARTRPG